MLQKDIIIQFSFLISLLLFFILIHGDDIGRFPITTRPSKTEAWIRIGYVFAKIFSSMYAAGLLMIEAREYQLIPQLNADEVTILLLVLSLGVGVVIRFLQNIIRRIQGRPPGRYLDLATLRYNSSKWKDLGRN